MAEDFEILINPHAILMSVRNLEKLLGQAYEQGLRVSFLPLHKAGLYFKKANLIVVNSLLPMVEQEATLAHELVHFERGHDGCQGAVVEGLVELEAAKKLIKPVDFDLALRAHQGRIWEIAEALEVSQVLVEKYAFWMARRKLG